MTGTGVSKRKDEEGNLVIELDPIRCRDSGEAAGDHTGASGTTIYDISTEAPTGAKVYPTRIRLRELANAAGLVYIYLGSVAAANLIEEVYLTGYAARDIEYRGRGGSVDIIVVSGTSTDVFAGVDLLVDSLQRATE